MMEKENNPYYLMINYGGWIQIVSKSKTIKGLENKLIQIGCNYKEVLKEVWKKESLEEVFEDYSNFYIGEVSDEYSQETNVGDVYVSEIFEWDEINDE